MWNCYYFGFDTEDDSMYSCPEHRNTNFAIVIGTDHCNIVADCHNYYISCFGVSQHSTIANSDHSRYIAVVSSCCSTVAAFVLSHPSCSLGRTSLLPPRTTATLDTCCAWLRRRLADNPTC